MSWTRDQEIKLTESVVAMSAFYGREFSDIALKMFVKVLMENDPDLVFQGIKNVLHDPAIRTMPTPAQLIATVKPIIDEKDNARDVATLLFRACRKRGDFWTAGIYVDGRPLYEGGDDYFDSFDKALIAEVGEVGAEVVRRYGGWGAIYNMYNTSPDGVFIAQIRDFSETVSKKSLGGTLHELPRLPKSIHQIENERRQLLRSQLKQLGPGDDAS